MTARLGVRLRDDPGGPRLVHQDLLGHELLDDPALQADVLDRARWREVPATRPATDVGDPFVEPFDARSGGQPPWRRAARQASRQPLTPPTVIPSTKNRWAKMKIRTTGRTTRVAAAISRL